MKKKIINVIYIFAVLTAVLALGTCGKRSSTTAPATIKIGTITDQTGPLKAFGIEAKWGYEKAKEEINKDGGIYVKEFDKKIPVEILYADHAANEQKTVTEAEYLTQQGVVVISGTTAIFPLGAAVADKNRIPMVVGFASHDGTFAQGFKYIFLVGWLDSDYAKWPFELIDYFPDPKPTKIGFMEEQEQWGQDISLYFKKEAERRKFTNFVIEKFQRFGKDLSPQILDMKKKGIDFVFAPLIGPDGLLFWRQSKELDFNPKAFLILQSPAVRADWLSQGKDADYVLTSNAYHWDLPYPGVKEFADKYRADHNGQNPTEIAGGVYACMQVIKDAIERAGTLDREELRDAIADTDVDTIVGPVEFKSNGAGEIKPFIVQYQNLVETTVWPDDAAKNKPIYPFPNWKSR